MNNSLVGNTTGKNNTETLIKILQESTLPPVKPPKKEKMKRIYEDDDFIIDLFPEEPMVRVSTFKDNHFQDEVFIRKE